MLPDTFKFDEIEIAIGDGASPEVFDKVVLMNTERGVQFTPSYGEDVVPDQDSAQNPAQLFQNIDYCTFSVTGSGKVDRADVKGHIQAAADGVPRNAKVRIGPIGVTGSVEISCKLVCTSFEVSASRPGGQTVEGNIAYASHGFKAADVADYTA